MKETNNYNCTPEQELLMTYILFGLMIRRARFDLVGKNSVKVTSISGGDKNNMLFTYMKGKIKIVQGGRIRFVDISEWERRLQEKDKCHAETKKHGN